MIFRRLVCALLVLLPPAAGFAADTELKLSVEEAVRTALEKNLDLEIEKVSPPIASDQIVQARSEFHPLFDYNLTYARQTRYLNNLLELRAANGLVRETRVTPEAELKGLLTSGTDYKLSAGLMTLKSDNPLRLFDVSYAPTVGIGFTQHLLRGFGRSVNLVKVRQAEQVEKQALLQVKAKMLDVIQDVETKYWILTYAQQHLDIAKDNLKVGEELIDRLKRMREAGISTDLDVSKASLAAEERRADVARAEADLKIAQARLRSTMDPDLPVTTKVIALETPQDEGPPKDLQKMIDRAMEARPEVEYEESVIENLSLQEKEARSNARWKLDATGGATYAGLGGKDVNPNLDPNVLFPMFPNLAPNLRPLPGGLEDRSGPLSSFRNGNYSWSLGLSLEIPLGNRVSLAQVLPTRLKKTQEELRLEQVKQQIQLDLEVAFHNMDAEWSQLNSAREAVRLAQLQVNAEERNLEVGLNTVWDVVEAQDRLATALDAEGKSMALYAGSRSRLHAEQAESFEDYNLVVEP